jgi:hypothetical protein
MLINGDSFADQPALTKSVARQVGISPFQTSRQIVLLSNKMPDAAQDELSRKNADLPRANRCFQPRGRA